ncbi:MAG: acyl-ACP desaturase [Salinisphaera sp.]|jgi:acyl-[acyl-carrier-protein] desaturase|nr:acyl-ACP desaturase [Salinisphaera sp.]
MAHYRTVVAECLDACEIGQLSPDDAAGRKAQDRLMAVPARLDRLADILEKRTRSESFSFDSIYARVLELS